MTSSADSKRRPAPVTIRQLARELKVSTATISLALRNSPRISEIMRKQVSALAARTGYRVNPHVSRVMGSLKQQRQKGTHGAIAVIFPSGSLIATTKFSPASRAVPAMEKRAEELGFSLDMFELDGMTMTPARLEQILISRGIEGLVIMNAVPAIDHLPLDLERFSVVAIGYSIRQPLPRVCLHQYQDMLTLCAALHERGYRRPGFLLYNDLNLRSNYQFSAAYFAASRFIFQSLDVPLFFGDDFPVKSLRTWLRRYQPDVLIHEQQYFTWEWLSEVLAPLSRSVPGDIGLASTDVIPAPVKMSGIFQGWGDVGSRAIEDVVGRIYQGLKGALANPAVEVVQGAWLEGETTPMRSGATISVAARRFAEKAVVR